MALWSWCAYSLSSSTEELGWASGDGGKAVPWREEAARNPVLVWGVKLELSIGITASIATIPYSTCSR
jgi:hypothetical protein